MGVADRRPETAIAQAGMGVALIIELLRPHSSVEAPEDCGDADGGCVSRQDLRTHAGAVRVVPVDASGVARIGDAELGRIRSRYSSSSSSRSPRRCRDRGSGDSGLMLAPRRDGAYAAAVRMIGCVGRARRLFTVVRGPFRMCGARVQ